MKLLNITSRASCTVQCSECVFLRVGRAVYRTCSTHSYRIDGCSGPVLPPDLKSRVVSQHSARGVFVQLVLKRQSPERFYSPRKWQRILSFPSTPLNHRTVMRQQFFSFSASSKHGDRLRFRIEPERFNKIAKEQNYCARMFPTDLGVYCQQVEEGDSVDCPITH